MWEQYLVSRYIWRGLDVNDQPNIQPSLSIEYSGFQLGAWGSYGLTHLNSEEKHYSVSQEIDTYITYQLSIVKEIEISALVTDYYYPRGGQKIGNFNNYDNINGPGAHTIEAGLTVKGIGSFPLALSGYFNIYNDAGNNSYFQADYSFNISGTELGIFIGATPGSRTNPSYYGTEKFDIINFGFKALREIKISEDFSLPVSCSYILNPNQEISYLVFAVSI